MGILTLLLIAIIAWNLIHFLKANQDNETGIASSLRKLKIGKSIGLLALITGILGQMIGLFVAFAAIERAGDVAPIVVYGGIKVSLISTLYGLIIYLFSILLWIILSYNLEKRR